jgi:hypothetical protein
MATYDQMGRSNENAHCHAPYLSGIVAGGHRRSARNEDDGNGRYFHLVKLGSYCFEQQSVEIRKPSEPFYLLRYPLMQHDKLNAVFTEKPTPPPKHRDQYV